MDASSVAAPAPGCALVPILEQGVVVDEAGARLHVLDGPGRAVWELLDGTRPVGAVADALAVRHALPRAAVEPGVLAAVAALVGAGALVVLPRPAGRP